MRARGDSADLLAPYLALLEQKAPRPLTIAEMARLLGVRRFDPKALRAGLERAVESHRLRRIGKTRYQWQRAVEESGGRRTSRKATRGAPSAVLAGRYTRVRAGFGFVELLGGTREGFGRDVL